MSFSSAARTKRQIVAASSRAMVAGLISGGHHWYGAVAFDTPWRLQVSFWIAAAPLFVVGLLYELVSQATPNPCLRRINLSNVVVRGYAV